MNQSQEQPSTPPAGDPVLAEIARKKTEASLETTRTQLRQSYFAKYAGDDQQGRPQFLYGREAAEYRAIEGTTP